MARFHFPKPVLPHFAAGLIILIGLALRLRQYLSGRSLWLDEAMLALNIVQRDFGGLLKPLDYDQGAPLGFLLLEKLTTSLLGNGELTLRLPSVIAGCLALLFFYLLLKRFLSPVGLLPALALFAISEQLIYYTSELKQYTFDVFVLLGLLLIFLYATQKKAESKPPDRAWMLLLGAGALAVWVSHPSVFGLVGIGLTLLWQNRQNWHRLTQVGLLLLAWLVSFGGVFLASLNALSANNFLMAYWQDYFMPMPPWSNPGWIVETLTSSLTYFAPELPTWLALTLLLAGFIHLWRLDSSLAAVFALTLLAGFGASALGKYPLGGRMLLFLAPISIGLVGAAFEGLLRVLERIPRLPRLFAPLMASLLAVFLLVPSAAQAVDNFISPRMQENIHPAMRTLRTEYQPDDLIYIYYGAMPAFRYYAPFYGFNENEFQAGKLSYNRLLAPTIRDIDSLKGNHRAWVLFSHVYEADGINEREAVLAYIDEQKMGKCRLESREPGTSVLLYLCNFAP